LRGERKFTASPCRKFFHAMRLEGCKRKLLLAMRYERFNGTQVAQIRQISADSCSVFLASLQKAKILQNQCV
jgi:hypothetical protein